jgi:hypothetical protein
MTKTLHNSFIQILCLLLLMSAQALKAATVIEVKSDSDLTTVMTDGQFARMNMSGDEYVIVDYRQQTVKLVNPQNQKVMILEGSKAAVGNSGPQVHTAIQNLGAGMTIAGYPTQKYAYSANGKTCGVIYGSMDVYQQQGIKELFQAVDTMMEQQRAVLGGLASMIDDCTLAQMDVGDHVKALGVPMRTEKNGRIESEIKSIKHDVMLPADTFVIPASYKTMTVLEQIRAAANGLANMQRQGAQNQPAQIQQPQMQQMVRQMPQSGQLSPEMMQQMRRNQEMMRQYQQPAYR